MIYLPKTVRENGKVNRFSMSSWYDIWHSYSPESSTCKFRFDLTNFDANYAWKSYPGIGQFQDPNAGIFIMDWCEPFVLGVQNAANCEDFQIAPPDPWHLKIDVQSQTGVNFSAENWQKKLAKTARKLFRQTNYPWAHLETRQLFCNFFKKPDIILAFFRK